MPLFVPMTRLAQDTMHYDEFVKLFEAIGG
jgi:hypothetical protein